MTTRYFALQEQIENLPLAAVQISPTNYTFRYRGEVNTGNGTAFVYDITPRKRRPGLFKGQIWIEGGSGSEVLISGRLEDAASMGAQRSGDHRAATHESGRYSNT